ncbi:hypothetical protein O9H85_14205 [Paenibacillus filicis]|uniref:HNH nuclease domain-containing protein n=1 Tax=Paenibacillus gyeongsangnamensis TaxID=3388067 RepID=A0ABT4QA68_9BACL|nr:hypothetical protein [Paenibacillus filicis]MCZ8513565.1 hypothetical protein [Paenibacillus filicis]
MVTTTKEIIHEIRKDENNPYRAILLVKRVGLLTDACRVLMEIPSYIDNDKDVFKIVQRWHNLIQRENYSNFIAHYEEAGNLPSIVGYRPKLDNSGMPVRNEHRQILYERIPIQNWIWSHINGTIPEGTILNHVNLWQHDNRLSNLIPVKPEEHDANKRNLDLEPSHDPNGKTYFDNKANRDENQTLYHGTSYVHNIFMGRFEPGDDYETGVLIHQVTPLLLEKWSRQRIYDYFNILKPGTGMDNVENTIQTALNIFRWKPDFL